MNHSDNQRCWECNSSNPFEDGHDQKHDHFRVTDIPLFLEMSLIDHLQGEGNREDSIDGDNDYATIGKEQIDPSVESHFELLLLKIFKVSIPYSYLYNIYTL